MQGTGNDYIYIDLITNDAGDVDFSNLAKKISNVNYGIGSDGLILICSSKVADAKMVMYNKDGSEAMMCGNGIRCVSKYLYDNLFKKKNITIETKSGVKKIKIKTLNGEVQSVIVDMGKPIFKPRKIPVLLDDEVILDKKVDFGDVSLKINCISVGNPHTVIFVPDVDQVNVKILGNLVQNNNLFPKKCNVEFVQIISRKKIKMRVWEIGSGETYSCGTGACASALCGILNGYLDKNSKIEVEVLGGTLFVTYDKNIYMEGPAKTICYGKYLL